MALKKIQTELNDEMPLLLFTCKIVLRNWDRLTVYGPVAECCLNGDEIQYL
jgi:hypothetical protein